MTEPELKQLAEDMKAGRVYTSAQLPTGDLLPNVFMPLAFMDDAQRADFMAKKPSLIYEYLDKAVRGSINGCPIFGSLHFVTEEEMPTLNRFWKELWGKT